MNRPAYLLRTTVQGIGAAGRRARRDAAFVLAYGALAAALAAGAVAAPLALTRAADDGLRAAVTQAGTAADVVVTHQGAHDLRRFRYTGDSYVPGATAASHDVLPPSVRAVTAEPVTVLAFDPESARTSEGAFAVRLVHAGGADVTWTEGEAPGAFAGKRGAPLDVGLSAAVAGAMGLRAGDTFELPGGGLTARVSGVFRPADAGDPGWTDVPDAFAPGEGGALGRPVSALISTASALALLDLPEPGPEQLQRSLSVSTRFPVDPAEFRASALGALRQDLVRADEDPVQLQADATTNLTRFVAGPANLLAVLDAYDARLAVARGQALTVLTGLVAACGLVLFLAANLLVARRRGALELERARGASVPSVALRAGAESVPVALLAGVVACGATLPAGGPPWGTGVVPAALVLAVAAGAPVVLSAGVAASSWTGRRVAANRRDRERGARLRRGWRLAAELTVVALASGAVAAALRRGIVPGGDLLVAAAPILLAGACTVLVLRSVAAALRAAARSAAGGRGQVPLVAASRAAWSGAGSRQEQERTAAAAPVLALTITAALTVSCAAAATTVRDGQENAAGTSVGAQARVVPGDDAGLAGRALAGAPGVTTAAGTVLAERTFAGGSGLKATLFAVDAAAFPQFRALAGGPEVAAGDPVPALLHPGLVTAAELVDPDVWVLDSSVPLTVAGTLDVAGTGPYWGPEIPAEPTVVVDRAALTASLGPDAAELPVDVVWLDGPGATEFAGELHAEASGSPSSSAVVTTRDGAAAALRDDPLAGGLVALYLVSAGLFTALGVTAVALTVLATAAGRTRALAVLRTLGLPRASGRALALAELSPVLAVALAAGTASGVVVAVGLTGAQDLGLLTGGGPPDLVLPWWPFALVAVTTAAGLVTAVALEARSRRHVRIGEVLRGW
ncbi:FtsX-like permease family protein [Myceligenerans crystallogenes]|uniref:ABC transport system permease protein n=1 Tax=Myceligenerans crystallogenes TaxID=316335 RepID=A0ABN2NM81_9MICO